MQVQQVKKRAELKRKARDEQIQVHPFQKSESRKEPKVIEPTEQELKDIHQFDMNTRVR